MAEELSTTEVLNILEMSSPFSHGSTMASATSDLPSWTFVAVDAETCVEITLDLGFYRTKYDWDVDDSRDFNSLCVCTTRLFQERYADADWSEVEWRDCIDDVVREVANAVNRDPAWLNNAWPMSHQTVDTLRTYLEQGSQPAPDAFVAALTDALLGEG